MNGKEAELFFEAWDNQKELFTIYSSGSTGAPKPISLERKWMIWSAEQTAAALKPKPGERLYCCIPVSKVGGLMMLVRSRVWNQEIIVVEPSANPLLHPVDADMVSLSPMQLFQVLQNNISIRNLNRFREVLIGGGEISPRLESMIKNLQTDTVFRHSYGMTETYSHIALRTVKGQSSSVWFKPFPSVNVSIGHDDTALIKTPFCETGLKTNDIIRLNDNGEFMVRGRKDFIINSGGIKLQAEEIEKAIKEHLNPDFDIIISSVKDDALGNKLVLVCEGDKKIAAHDLYFLSQISKYAIPKIIISLEEFPRNAGGKTDRLKIAGLLADQ